MSPKDSTVETAVVYQSVAARVALMYRLPSVVGNRRTLLLTVPGRDLVPAQGWDGEVVRDFVGYDCASLLDYADASFDRVVLHWVLDEFVASPGRKRSTAQRIELLRQARRLLRPGGVVTGCLANFLIPTESLRWPIVGWTGAKCQSALRGAGFEHVRVSTVLPSADLPQIMISVDRTAARDYFRHQLKRTRQHFNPVSRLARRVLIEAGAASYLQGSLAFSGSVPC